MHYALAPHIRVCRTQCGTVGLDLLRNRYFGLGVKETSLLTRLGVLPYGEPALLPDPQISTLSDALLRAGVLIQTDAPARADHSGSFTAGPTPTASAGYEYNDNASIRVHHVLNLLRAFAWAKLVLRRRSFYALSRQLTQARLDSNESFDNSSVIALVSVFRQLRPFVYCARERCLLHALTLTRFLMHYDQHPSWIIGVRTRPWAAHSWVQAGAMVLDGRPDDVCDYTPILLV